MSSRSLNSHQPHPLDPRPSHRCCDSDRFADLSLLGVARRADDGRPSPRRGTSGGVTSKTHRPPFQERGLEPRFPKPPIGGPACETFRSIPRQIDETMDYGVIMAGGAGTRLWPLSRSERPKQLLQVVRGKSLLQLSYERLRGMLPAERIYVCTGEAHGHAVLENLPDCRRKICSASRRARDTANAVGFPAAVLHKRDKDAVPAFVTADHVIEPVEKFQAALKTAFDVVARAAQRAGHLRHRPHARPHRPRLHPSRRAADGQGQARAARTACRRSRKSPTSRRPTATSNPAGTTGTAACSSGGATRC